jgi:hypothetical protein
MWLFYFMAAYNRTYKTISYRYQLNLMRIILISFFFLHPHTTCTTLMSIIEALVSHIIVVVLQSERKFNLFILTDKLRLLKCEGMWKRVWIHVKCEKMGVLINTSLMSFLSLFISLSSNVRFSYSNFAVHCLPLCNVRKYIIMYFVS